MEATGGFEPPNRGFADLRLNHLATSPYSSLIPDSSVSVFYYRIRWGYPFDMAR